MRLGIKGKQVLGVTSIVGTVVVVLSVLHLARLASVSLDESRARAELLANAIYHRAQQVVVARAEPLAALRADPGLRSILESSLYSKNVMYAALVDVHGVAVAHADRSLEGQPLPPVGDLGKLLERSPLSQLRAIYSSQGQNLEFRGPLLLGDTEIGSTRIGVSTLLIRQDLDQSLRPALVTALAALAVSVLVATLLSQLFLRPIHMIRSGLTRLGKGEFGVQLDLNQQDEFGELGTFFNTVSEQLSADRSQMAGQVANLESAVEQLEDAVAIVNARGELLFTNPAMRALLPDAAPGASLDAMLPADHPLRRLSEQTFVSRQSRGPLSAPFGDSGERLVMTHAINDPKGDLVGIMLIARNVEYLSEVQSTVRYSRKLAALGRLSAGVAHEVKNPLNAMMIHLELLRQQFAPARRSPAAGGSGAGGRRRSADGSQRGAAARGRHRARDPPARRSRAGVPEVLAARGSEAAAAGAAIAVRRDRPDRAAGGRTRARAADRGLRRRARRQRRSGDAPPGVPQPRAQRLPGDAERRDAADSLRAGSPFGGLRASRVDGVQRHRRRHRA